MEVEKGTALVMSRTKKPLVWYVEKIIEYIHAGGRLS